MSNEVLNFFIIKNGLNLLTNVYFSFFLRLSEMSLHGLSCSFSLFHFYRKHVICVNGTQSNGCVCVCVCASMRGGLGEQQEGARRLKPAKPPLVHVSRFCLSYLPSPTQSSHLLLAEFTSTWSSTRSLPKVRVTWLQLCSD